MRKIFFFLTLASLLLAPETRLLAAAYADTHYIKTNIDSNKSPKDDFYDWAVGSWVKDNPVPADASRWGAIEISSQNNYDELKDLLEHAAAATSNSPKTDKQKAGLFYATAIDQKKADQEGIQPIQSDLGKFEFIGSPADVARASAEMEEKIASPFFNFSPAPDEKDSQKIITQISEGGLGLPDRDYYLSDEEYYRNIREKYTDHIADMFQKTGEEKDQAKSDAQDVLVFETELAKVSTPKEDLRDPQNTYNKMDLSQVESLAPHFDWASYFQTLGIPDPGEINIDSPDYLKGLDVQLAGAPLSTLKNYLKWNLLRSSAPYLSSDFADANFDFYGKTLSGQDKERPRWEEAIDSVNAGMSMALGKMYVSKYFSPEKRSAAEKLVKNISSAMEDEIKDVSWMSDETKNSAIKKLHAMAWKVGYPDEWINYAGLEVKNDSYLSNVERARQFAFTQGLKNIGKKRDPNAWGMTPQTANACYIPTSNEIIIPAGILQAPFFDPNADPAANYGQIGSIIGHEITHAFDDQGRHYDENGNLSDWWTSEDSQAFEARAEILARQYDSYSPVDGSHVNGKFTLGENIADLGGVKVAYRAMEKEIDGKNIPEIDGYSQEQRFFLAQANIWKGNDRTENLKLRLEVDPHSPGKYRVDGPDSNFTAFMKAFEIKPDDKMYRDKKDMADIW